MHVRLRDVATHASVSIQTVSRVLRTPHLVAPETAERVRAAMLALGYVKNEQATALRVGRSRTIGLLFPLLAWPFWSGVAIGAEARAHERGYSLLFCDTSDSLTKEEEYISLLLGSQVAGIIYCIPRCLQEQHQASTTLVRSGTPVVVLSVVPEDLPYRHVHTDDRRAGYVAIRHLLDIGRQNIAIVAADSNSPDDLFTNHRYYYKRVQGARDALLEMGLGDTSQTVYFVPNTFEYGRVLAQKLLSLGPNRPDAIFCTSDPIAFGLLEVFRSSGIHVPGDIAVISHDGLPNSSFTVPSLTTIAPRTHEMGKICVDQLLQLNDQAEETTDIIVEADLIVRASTIGTGLTTTQGFTTPLSQPDAWSQWRMQRIAPEHKDVTIVSVTLDRALIPTHDREQ